MKFLSRFKKLGKYLLGIAAAAAVVSQLVLPAVSMRADAPRFNFLDGDHELFKGLNYSAGEDVWKDPIAGEAGDTLSGYVYYHNGVVDSEATNTTIKVTIPNQTSNKTAVLSASISADNAETVTNTIVDNQVIGKSGLTVNLDQDANVSFIPGSVKWYPNKSTVASALPFGQSGDEIVSANGLNIGGIKGCWEFSGYVTFAFKTKVKAQPASLTLAKTVKNVSAGQTAFVESVNAAKGEKVQFKIDTVNNGGLEATNVIVSDLLPSDLTAVTGSAKLDKAGVISTISLADLLSSGVNIGSLAVGQKATVTFEATAPASISDAKTVINTAKVTSGNITLTDTAQVCLVAGVINIVKSKAAYNQTQSVDATQRAAGAGDTIEYTLVTKNTGNSDTDYVVSDGITDILEYADLISISDGGKQITGTTGTSGNDLQIVSYPSAKIVAGGQIVRKFTVKVKNPLPNNPANGFSFDDKMFNVYGNEVVVLIGRPTPPVKLSELKINKFVRDVTKNELDFVKLNTAYSGDTLEYKITFENVGNAPADNVKIYDSLPANVILDTSVPAIFAMNGQEKSIAENITSGYTVRTIMPGDSGYIRFRAIIANGLADNERLVNTGYLDDDGKIISAQAETIVKLKIVPTLNPISSLPKTGAPLGIGISLLASLFTTANVVLLKQKKSLLDAARKINLS